MPKLVNRARMTTATVGTGTITLGAAVDGFQSFSAAGISDGDQVRYVIEDGTDWEIGLGIYTVLGTTLSRTPSESSNAGAAIALTGSAQVFVTAAGEDLATAAQGALADSAVQPADLSAALRYVLKSGTYTAAPGERIAADVSGGAWVLSLPAAPSAGDGVMISVVSGDVTVNNLTIAGNGNTVQGDATLVVDVALATVSLVYNGTEWRVA